MTYFELEDADFALLMSRERRGGQVAIWSLVLIFLVPGLMDGSIALVTLGGAFAVSATIATIRAFRRPWTPVPGMGPPRVRHAPDVRAARVGAADACPPARGHVQPDARAPRPHDPRPHDPRPHRLPHRRRCAPPDRGTGTRWVTTGRPARRRSRPGSRRACARQ
ncbi:MAG TPA: hypothetical protein VGN59_09975 [Acidimicrobiia bacterium]